MFDRVDPRQDAVAQEHEVLAFWAEKNVFEKLVAQNADGPRWSFLDGPITANNPMGVHHAWGRTYKDCFQRFRAMQGCQLRYQNGFDCQGLWVEVEVEKELGFKTKRDIETYGVEEFVNRCKARAAKYAAVQTAQSVRLGYWMDWENSYYTMDDQNNYMIWSFLKKCHGRGLVYKGADSMPWCPRCGTGISQHEMHEGYREVTDRAVYVRLPLHGRDGEFLLVWTTTPWTLPANVVCAVNPELTYLKVACEGESYYIAEAKAELLLRNGGKVVAKLPGKNMLDWGYDGPFDELPAQQESRELHRVVAWSEVTDTEGTGVVHIAPGCGKEDFDLVARGGSLGSCEVDASLPTRSRPVSLRSAARSWMDSRSGGSRAYSSTCGERRDGWAPRAGDPKGGVSEDDLAQQDRNRRDNGGRGGGEYAWDPNQEAEQPFGRAPGCDHPTGRSTPIFTSPYDRPARCSSTIHPRMGPNSRPAPPARELQLPVLAPIDENGDYVAGYGPFAGTNAAIAATVVLESLKAKGFHWHDEDYVHSYPHCWRCGTPLLYRHVSEWFVDMSWREEIREAVRASRWLPEWGQARELDWLDNMRDWMISKKRYWGLALPIYECECGWFDVIGDRDELRRRAVAGWEEFDGHSPHRPWVDHVQVACGKCGKPVSRIPDVGNPWLDAGIVPYSTLRYADDRAYWQQWMPADLVVECFPGQFRNWFYALLAMSTMMEQTTPFRTLFGHALVKDENGEEMHKSKGNAIWFDDAAQEMGVDVMRWLFCRQDPTANLSFGYHLGVMIARGPLSTWRNVYAFFCNYAGLDGFDLSANVVPVADRPDMDRWLLSNFQLLVDKMGRALDAYDVATAVKAAETFLERLSNWYVRCNRKRFWRDRDASDTDKLAAYQTLHEVLVGLCKLLAPVVPFMTENMYLNLVSRQDPRAPMSVHLCRYPEPDAGLIDQALSQDMDAAADLVSSVLSARQAKQLRVRQPLARLLVACTSAELARGLQRCQEHVLDQVNVKTLAVGVGDLSDVAGEPLDDSAWTLTDGAGMRIALDVRLSDDLLNEGMARDFVRHVQTARKALGLDLADRIVLRYRTESAELQEAVRTWTDYITTETLADSLTDQFSGEPDKSAKITGHVVELKIQKSS